MLANKKTRQIYGITLSVIATILSSTTVSAKSDMSQFSLGTNAAGDFCTASLNWNDPSLGESGIKFSDTYSVSCRGAVIQAQALARVRNFDDQTKRSSFTSSLECGEESSVSIDGFSEATANRCIDPGLGFTTVLINANRNGSFYQISSAPNAVGAAYQAMRILGGLDKPGDASSDRQILDLSSLTSLDTLSAINIEPERVETFDSLLSRGTALNFRGLHADASRYLASALESEDLESDNISRIELLLEAGLADSNIKFFRSAEAKFDQAQRLSASLSGIERAAMRTKFQNYNGLHALNKREFGKAQSLLSGLLASSLSQLNLLEDPNTFLRLNASATDTADVRGAMSLPDERLLRENFLLSHSAWALSVAELSLGNTAAADQALTLSADRFALLESLLSGAKINDNAVFWLSARLDRQRGRILAAQGKYDRALSSFDQGVETLTRGAIALSGTGNEPVIAEFLLERAALVNRAGKSPRQISAAYEKAVNALLNARDESFAFSTTALLPYVEGLANSISPDDQSQAEKYFQALQIKSESGAAKQISQLQTITASDPNTSAKLQDSQGLQRELSRLSLEINESQSQGRDASDLLAERQLIQQEYFELEAEIQSSRQNSTVATGPASLANLQATLSPGETYLKLNVVGDEIYGALIEKTALYPIKSKVKYSQILPRINKVRDSIDGQIESGTVSEFDVISSVIVYQSLFKSVDDVLKRKSNAFTELIVDAAPVLNGISVSVLVSDPDGARKFLRQSNKLDYTDTEFMVNWISNSVAISPKSFIASRNLGPSAAQQPFIGFGSPKPLSDLANLRTSVQVGPCLLDPTQIRALSRRFSPIPTLEIELAANALSPGSDIPMIKNAEFTDSKILGRGSSDGDLAEYKVLHFATHGLTEGQFGCSESPAALLTSLGDTGSDMLLSFDEIARLRLDANLVVLSACETASEIGERALKLSGEAVPGATLEGLVRAFFSANARSVLATFWESSNNGESEIFMEEFYKSGRLNSISEALNDAQRSLLETQETSHPFYWGGFFVVGDTSNTMLSGI